MSRKVIQMSVDIEIDDTDDFREQDIEQALFSYWYCEKIPNREVLGVSWKATWNDAENYHRGYPCDSWD